MLDLISPGELLHRAIKPNPIFWNTKSDCITSALFKDSKGVSVDRNAGRSDDEIKSAFLASFSDLKGEARLRASLCFDNRCQVIADPIANNAHHALIQGEDKVELSKGQAKQLASNCQVIHYE